MKLKEKFILHSNINKPPPKQEKSIDNFSLIFGKIPSKYLKENPIVGIAANRKRKPLMTIINKYKKPEFVGLNKQMEDNEKKVVSEINNLKEIIYDHYKEKDMEMNNYGRIKHENIKFSKIYNKIRKEKMKFSTGTYLDYEPFINISNKYISKHMKVPNLSLDHNIFSGNPLILEGSELEDYIKYNLRKKDKSIKFLNKIDDLLNKKKMGSFIESPQEMENLEDDRKNEKEKGYIPPKIEINKLKNDIKSTRSSFKDLDGFDNYFDSLKKRKKIIEKFSLLKNKSSGNLFNNISNNNIDNSNNNLDNIYNNANKSNVNIKNRRNYSHYSKYQNLAINNSDITDTTYINFSRNPSSLETFRDLNFLSNVNDSLYRPRQHESKKIKLSPINSPFLFSSKNSELHKKFSDKSLHSRNNLKLILQKGFLLNSSKIKKHEIPRGDKINKLNLNELNKKENISILSDGDKDITNFSEIDDFFQINKEFENINKRLENNNSQKFKSEIKDYTKHLDLDNDIKEIKIKGKEKEPNFNRLKDEKEIKINQLENLFEITKNEGLNLKDKKKEIENYAISKGKDLNNLLNKKDTYFSIYRLKKKALEKNIFIEELILRKGSKIKLPYSKKEKIFLAKNKNFLDGIINQEKKIKEIIIENKIQ